MRFQGDFLGVQKSSRKGFLPYPFKLEIFEVANTKHLVKWRLCKKNYWRSRLANS